MDPSQLADRARQLEEIHRVARLGSYRLNLTTGLWTSSPTLDRIFGLEDEGLCHDVDRWLELVHPDEREEMLAYLQTEVLGRGHAFDREYRILRASDGELRWVHGLGELVTGSDDEPRVMVGTVWDITDRRRAEATALELERRLLHSQKLESLGLLAGGIAHDFNNLLMAVIGNLDLALLTLPDDTPARDSIERAVEAAHRSTNLTRQMLAYSGRASFMVEDLDLNTLILGNLRLLEASLAKTISIDQALAPELPPVHADAGQLQQVMMNLVRNAAESLAEDGGIVTIASGSGEIGADELAGSRIEEIPQPGTFVWVEISDTGCGMDEGVLDRLFDPFFTTKSSGRGLGLSAVLGIIRGHHGAILVDSEPSTGTTVRVLLPAAPAPAIARAPAPTGESAQSVPGTTILVVDDEEVVRSLVRRMLERLGHVVLEAADGLEGVAAYREHAEMVSCVILDLSMPRMDGVQALARLRDIDPEVRVILASGYDRDDALHRFDDAGPTTFIHKPFRFSEMRSVLARVLD